MNKLIAFVLLLSCSIVIAAQNGSSTDIPKPGVDLPEPHETIFNNAVKGASTVAKAQALINYTQSISTLTGLTAEQKQSLIAYKMNVIGVSDSEAAYKASLKLPAPILSGVIGKLLPDVRKAIVEKARQTVTDHLNNKPIETPRPVQGNSLPVGPYPDPCVSAMNGLSGAKILSVGDILELKGKISQLYIITSVDCANAQYHIEIRKGFSYTYTRSKGRISGVDRPHVVMPFAKIHTNASLQKVKRFICLKCNGEGNYIEQHGAIGKVGKDIYTGGWTTTEPCMDCYGLGLVDQNRHDAQVEQKKKYR